MAYFVAHMQKHSQGGIKSHNERDFKNHSNLNIDKSKTNLNVELVSSRNSKDSYESQYNKLIKDKYNHRKKNGELKKIRADQVKFNSFVFSASPEFFKDKSHKEAIKYFEDCKKFMESKIESENIISAKVHMDELTPHMHLIVVPLTKDGRLSSKELFNRNFLRNLQDECPKFLQNNSHDVQRGVDAQGINKRVSDLEFQKEKALKLENELKISKVSLKSKEYYENLTSDILENRKSKLLFSKASYKITKEELESLTKKASLVDKYSLEVSNLKKQNTALLEEVNGVRKLESDNRDLKREIKKLSKFKELIKERTPKEIFDKFEEKVSIALNPWKRKLSNSKVKNMGKEM